MGTCCKGKAKSKQRRRNMRKRILKSRVQASSVNQNLVSHWGIITNTLATCWVNWRYQCIPDTKTKPCVGTIKRAVADSKFGDKTEDNRWKTGVYWNTCKEEREVYEHNWVVASEKGEGKDSALPTNFCVGWLWLCRPNGAPPDRGGPALPP